MALSEESFLPDAEDCAETWRELRWPDGPECVECGSSDVAVQDWDYLSIGIISVRCAGINAESADDGSTTDPGRSSKARRLESSKVRLPVWVYVLREMDKERSINSIAKDLSHTYKTVHRVATTMREAIYQRREEWHEVLTGKVEADDVHLTLGQQGRTLRSDETRSDETNHETNQSEGSEPELKGSREPRERGLSERGRGSWSGDRPPAVLWVERGGSGRVLELQPDVRKRTLVRSALRNVELGSRIDTDDFSSYRLLEAVYDHRSVDHEETYVSEEGVHCNTAETATPPKESGPSSSLGGEASAGLRSAMPTSTSASIRFGGATDRTLGKSAFAGWSPF